MRSIIDLGRNVTLRIIAEGVVQDAHLAFLRQFCCTLVQGYLPGRPMQLAQLIAARFAPAVHPA